MKMLAESMTDIVKRQRAFVDKLASISPPPSVQNFHAALLEMNQGAITYTESMLSKCEHGDFDGFGRVSQDAEKYTADWLPKIKAEADKAHIEM